MAVSIKARRPNCRHLGSKGSVRGSKNLLLYLINGLWAGVLVGRECCIPELPSLPSSRRTRLVARSDSEQRTQRGADNASSLRICPPFSSGGDCSGRVQACQNADSKYRVPQYQTSCRAAKHYLRDAPRFSQKEVSRVVGFGCIETDLVGTQSVRSGLERSNE